MRTRFQIWDYLRALFNFPSLQSDAQGKTCSYADRLVWCHCFALKPEKKTKKRERVELETVASHVSSRELNISLALGGINAGTAIEISCFIPTIEIYSSVQKDKKSTNLILKDK